MQQREKFFHKRFEEKKRDEALKNQEVIDFKNPGTLE